MRQRRKKGQTKTFDSQKSECPVFQIDSVTKTQRSVTVSLENAYALKKIITMGT